MSDNAQQGFSLIETLFAVLLFTLSLTALLHYYQALAEGFQQQWQQRNVWQNARQRLEGNPLDDWVSSIQQQPGPEGCQLVTVQVISPVGRHAELTQLFCINGELRQ